LIGLLDPNIFVFCRMKQSTRWNNSLCLAVKQSNYEFGNLAEIREKSKEKEGQNSGFDWINPGKVSSHFARVD
jgi:hypothetical protein